MTVRTKPHIKKSVQNTTRAPQRGTSGYWVPLVVFAFLFPSIYSTVVSGLIFYSFDPTLGFLGLPIGFGIGFYCTHRVHDWLSALTEEQYHKLIKRKGNTLYIAQIPKKGSTLYQGYIYLRASFFPLAFLVPIQFFVLCVIAPNLFFLIPFITAATVYGRYKHLSRKFSRMNKREYRQYIFKVMRSSQTVEEFDEELRKNMNGISRFPYNDPADPMYWVLGPGRSNDFKH